MFVFRKINQDMYTPVHKRATFPLGNLSRVPRKGALTQKEARARLRDISRSIHSASGWLRTHPILESFLGQYPNLRGESPAAKLLL